MNDMIELRPIKNEFDEHDTAYDDIIAGELSEDNCDNGSSVNYVKSSQYNNFPENHPVRRLKMRVPEAPDNLLELIYRKKCTECNIALISISSAIAHYNSTKHQTKLAFLFLPYGTLNLPLTKDDIREIETGVSKNAEAEKWQQGPQQMTLRELITKFEITEDIKKLNFDFCRLCQCPFPSKISSLLHYSGKKHKQNLENYCPYNPLTCSNMNVDLYCEVCNMAFGASGQMESHLASKKHQGKLKMFMDQVNSGEIIPPMSSRGFYDFNNVEREEANPFDASKFILEVIMPSNIMRPSFAGVSRHENKEPLIYDNGLFQAQYPQVPIQGGFINEYTQAQQQAQPSQQCYGGMVQNFAMGNNSSGGGGGGQYQMASFGTSADTSLAFREGRMPPPPWSNQGSSAPTSGAYTPNFTNRMTSKVPVQNFGPTKFKYTKKQSY